MLAAAIRGEEAAVELGARPTAGGHALGKLIVLSCGRSDRLVGEGRGRQHEGKGRSYPLDARRL